MDKLVSKVNFNLFIAEKFSSIMNEEHEKLKKKISKHNDNLAKIGKQLSENQFNYKIIENTTEQYWQDRINEFKKYNEKGIEFYLLAYELMICGDKEQSKLFLFMISKLRQIGFKLVMNMEQIRQNPSCIKSKDKQQSKWSKELREKLVESNNEYMHHEMKMNKFFRTFYETNLKNILE